MSFEVYYEYNSVEYKIYPFGETEGTYFRNAVGSPCASVSQIGIGEEGYVTPTPGRYRVTFDGSLNANVELVGYPDHIFNRDTIPVDISTGNSNINIIPGLAIELAPSTLDYYIFDVFVGGVYISDEQRIKNVLAFGYIQNGRGSDEVTLKIKNVSGENLEDIKVYVLNKAVFDPDGIPSPLYSAYQRGILNPVSFFDNTTKEISFDNLSSGTIQMLVDDFANNLIDISDYTEMIDGKGLSVDDTTRYMFNAGTDYQGITATLASDTEETDTADFYVSAGSGCFYVKNASDSSWVPAANGLNIGDLDDDESMEIDLKCLPPSTISETRNPIEGVLQIIRYDHRVSLGLIFNVIEWHEALIFRIGVISSDTSAKLAEFGITYAT